MSGEALRVVDLGRCTAQEYFAASDVPALCSDETPVVVCGTIDEDNLSLGYNRRWEATLTTLPDGFTQARFTTMGGMMYCRNVGILRAWMPAHLADPFDIQSLLTHVAIDELEAVAGRSLPIDTESNYAVLSGQKFVGGANNLIKGRASGLIQINVGPTDFAAFRPAFKAKKLLAVRDLAEFALPDSYLLRVIDRFAAEAGGEAHPSRWTREEQSHLDRLRKVHADPRWIGDEVIMDLFDFRTYCHDAVLGPRSARQATPRVVDHERSRGRLGSAKWSGLRGERSRG